MWWPKPTVRFHRALWLIAAGGFAIGIPLLVLGFRHSDAIDGTALSGYIEEGTHYVELGTGEMSEVPAHTWWFNTLLYGVGFADTIAGMLFLFVAGTMDLVRPIFGSWFPKDNDRMLK